MLVKICGATSLGDIELLASAGADLVGLWHGVPGGRADLPPQELAALAEAAHRTQRLRPVLVTFLNDTEALRTALTATRVDWIQLHGYQTPGTVRALKRAGDRTVIKVVHVAHRGAQRAGACPELPLIPSYERAGTDLFLVDATAEDGRIGSTGHQVDGCAVLEVVERMSRPFLLAGGISADSRPDYRAVLEHPLFRGIDVDTAARDPDSGRLRAERVTALVRGWRAGAESSGAES
ncbi:N-(5'-phosphoribosyl)anthranilate isomerase [Streptomyces sp. NBC_00237]|uniref:phosphoribosylanthranilate isomerase n=1 Tax=Streptomyces sp. NBC_00237 TaxID=2975687 RepID=UPI0022569632|nr:N-(5'-phosphoribosyl)anthranilate isomerase [Streptomyces sp. NBC_00237]MCX5202712.1 N-(5'-phosphoribosyl)anthranilate isomerase [Streptomyces sp. NBC_00237]